MATRVRPDRGMLGEWLITAAGARPIRSLLLSGGHGGRPYRGLIEWLGVIPVA